MSAIEAIEGPKGRKIWVVDNSNEEFSLWVLIVLTSEDFHHAEYTDDAELQKALRRLQRGKEPWDVFAERGASVLLKRIIRIERLPRSWGMLVIHHRRDEKVRKESVACGDTLSADLFLALRELQESRMCQRKVRLGLWRAAILPLSSLIVVWFFTGYIYLAAGVAEQERNPPPGPREPKFRTASERGSIALGGLLGKPLTLAIGGLASVGVFGWLFIALLRRPMMKVLVVGQKKERPAREPRRAPVATRSSGSNKKENDNDDDEPSGGGLKWALVGMGAGALVIVPIIVVLALNRGGPAPDGGPVPEQPGQPGQGKPPDGVAPPAGLVARWSLDEGQGKTARDHLGQGFATIHGGEWIQGVKGTALRLDGNRDFVDLGPDQRLNFPAGAGFTLAGWAATQANGGVICSFRRSTSGFPVINVSVQKGLLQGFVRDDTSGFGAAKVVGGPMNDGKWHHVALVRQANGAVELFLDGVFQARDQGKSSAAAITTDLRALGSDRFIAQTGKIGPPNFAGSIDDFHVYGRALDAKEIGALAGQK